MISRKAEQVFDSDVAGGSARATDGRDRYDQRLNHILQAATMLIARDGYDKASMRAVAKSAGVSLAGLYHYFDGKEKMLFLIQFRTFTALLNNLREKLLGIDEPVEQLRVMVRSHVSYFAANMAALKTCSHELDSLTGAAYDETREIRRAYYDTVRAVIDRLLSGHGIANTHDRHVATMSLFGTLNWLYRWYDPKNGRSPTAIANQIAEQFLHGMLGAPTTSRNGSAPADSPGTNQSQAKTQSPGKRRSQRRDRDPRGVT